MNDSAIHDDDMVPATPGTYYKGDSGDETKHDAANEAMKADARIRRFESRSDMLKAQQQERAQQHQRDAVPIMKHTFPMHHSEPKREEPATAEGGLHPTETPFFIAALSGRLVNVPADAVPVSLHPSTFEYLKPTDAQVNQMAVARAATKQYAEMLDAVLPLGPDKTYVLRKIREIGMWANVAITRDADGTPRT